MALALVPYEHVIGCFKEIEAEADQLPGYPMKDFLLYFENNWLDNIDLWNVSTCDSRTNNACEGKNDAWNF